MNLFEGKTILCVFAHADDHILFGWPMLQNAGAKRVLLMAMYQGDDIHEQYCKQEKIVYLPPMGLYGKFAIQEGRRLVNSCKKIVEHTRNAVKTIRPDYIYTHNPMGEYGHVDHKCLFSVVYNTFNVPLLISDILADSSYCVKYNGIPNDCRWAYANKVCDVEPDINKFNRAKRLYRNAHIWTKNVALNKDCPRRVGMYEVR